MNQTIGTCSICGGQVTLPSIWMGIIPPEPTCSSCGAVRAEPPLPVIPMRPAHPVQTTTGTGIAPTRWATVHW